MNRHFFPRARPAGRVLAAAVACALLGSFALDGVATTLMPLELPELVDRADAIVIGHARSAETVWVGRELYTRYQIEVQEQWLGAAATQLHVMVPGGIDRNRARPIAFSVEGAPQLRQDEPVALFLQRGGPLGADEYRIVGFNQGRFTLAGAADAQARSRQIERLRQRLQPLIEARGRPELASTPGAGRAAGRATPRGLRVGGGQP